MPLGGGGGNQKDGDKGEGEGGGSTFGSKGEAKDMEGPLQIPHCCQNVPAPRMPVSKGEKSLGAIFEGFDGWAIEGGHFLVFPFLFFLFFCNSFFFFFSWILAWCLVLFVFCIFLLLLVLFFWGGHILLVSMIMELITTNKSILQIEQSNGYSLIHWWSQPTQKLYVFRGSSVPMYVLVSHVCAFLRLLVVVNYGCISVYAAYVPRIE